jgi:hypothetical protein
VENEDRAIISKTLYLGPERLNPIGSGRHCGDFAALGGERGEDNGVRVGIVGPSS